MELQQDTLENKKHLPGIKSGILVICIYVVLSALLAPIFSKLSEIYPDLASWQLFIAFVLSFGILTPIAFKIFKTDSFDLKAIPFHYYLILIPGVIAMAVVVESIVVLIPMSDYWAELFASAIKFNLPTFLSVAIAAPIFEELIFRGIILKGFLKKYNPQVSIILSAVLFGVAHMNPWQLIAAFIVGYVIGWLYWKTKSILPGLFIHFVNNTISFALAYEARDINTTFAEFVGSKWLYAGLLFASVAICFVIGWYFYKQFTPKAEK